MAAIFSETPVIQGPGFWARQFGPNRTGGQDAFDVTFGLILPILCFMADPIVFKSLALIGRPLLEDYQSFAYVVSTVEMGFFLVWRTFPARANTLSPVFGGVFLLGACVSGLIGVIMLPLTLSTLLFVIGLVGLIPFLTAFVYLRTGIRALNVEANVSPFAPRITVATLSGLLVIGSLVVACTFAENSISASVDTVIYGNAVEAEAAVNRLKWIRFIPAKHTTRLALAYGREWNDEKKAILARAYWEITGDDVDRWSRMLAD